MLKQLGVSARQLPLALAWLMLQACELATFVLEDRWSREDQFGPKKFRSYQRLDVPLLMENGRSMVLRRP